MLHAGRDADNVALVYLLDRAFPALHPASSRGHQQHLAKRVGVPSRARTGGKRYRASGGARGGVCPKQGINLDRTGEVFLRCVLGSLRARVHDGDILWSRGRVLRSTGE